PAYRNVSAGGRRWRVVAVQAKGPSDELTVQVARSLDDFDHESAEVLLALLLAGPLTLVAAARGGHLLAPPAPPPRPPLGAPAPLLGGAGAGHPPPTAPPPPARPPPGARSWPCGGRPSTP